MKRLLNVLIGVDETANAALGGKPRETISGSIGRALLAGRWWAPLARLAVDALFGKGHCAAEAASEAQRAAEIAQAANPHP